MGPDVQGRQVIGPIRLLPLCPFPPLGWWCASLEEGARLDAGEHYPKRTFRNRFTVVQSTGPLSITMPVERRGGRPRPQDVTARMCDAAVGRKAWRAVRTAYGNAPFFEEMADELEALFMNGPADLGAWNRSTMAWAASWLGLAVPKDAGPEERSTVNHAASMTAWQEEWAACHAGWPHIWDDRQTPIPHAALGILDALLHLGPEAVRWVTPLQQSGSAHQG